MPKDYTNKPYEDEGTWITAHEAKRAVDETKVIYFCFGALALAVAAGLFFFIVS